MSENSGINFGFLDWDGLFLPLARRLADGNTVYYQTPPDRRDRLNEAVIGDGFPELQVVEELWLVKSKLDCLVFPDVRAMGQQHEWRSQGFPVWGAGQGMRLELNREFFLKKLKALGLDVPKYEIVVGITALSDFLKDKKDIYIKVSKWRGSWETFHWRSWEQDSHHVDLWAVKFGGMKEKIRFICFDAIKTKLEIGADTYNIDGEWPDTMLHGIEKKDEAYFAAVTPREKMPEELLHVMEAFSPYLKEVGYRCQWSMECRVTDNEVFFIDPTCRGGLPSTGTLTMAKNVPEIIYQGAKGIMVQPDYGFKYSAECMVKLCGEKGCYETIVFKPELADHLKLQDCCMIDGQIWWPSDEGKKIEHIGWLVATGDTPTEVAKTMNALADKLPDGANASVEDLAEVFKEIEEEEKEGIQFGKDPIPDPAVVLETT